jgi:hypothetical protein
VSTPFTRSGYADLLAQALDAGYEFGFYDDVPDAPRVCLLRHDVDADLGAAAELARIEHDAGVRATYFCMLRSPLYNLFARANVELVQEIVGFEHAIGLHYDVGVVPNAARTHDEQVVVEARALSDLLGLPIRVVSFHQPSANPRAAEIQTPGLVSAYDFDGFEYVSDTNKAEEFADLELPPRVQLLVHPLWWATDDPGASTEELWDAAILANVRRAQGQLVATERAYGPARDVWS